MCGPLIQNLIPYQIPEKRAYKWKVVLIYMYIFKQCKLLGAKFCYKYICTVAILWHVLLEP